MGQAMPANAPLTVGASTISQNSPNVIKGVPAPKAVTPAAPPVAGAPAAAGAAPAVPPVVVMGPDGKPVAPVVEAPAVKSPGEMSFTEKARAKSKAIQAQRVQKEQAAALSQQQRQIEARAQRVAQEEAALRDNPAEWMGRRMSTEQIADHFKNGGKLTPDQELQLLRDKVTGIEKKAQQDALNAQIAAENQKILANADTFVEWVGKKGDTFLALSSWPETDVKAAYLGIQERARAAGVPEYTKKEVAEFLDDYLQPYAKKVAESFST